MSATFTIRARQAGSKRRLLPDYSVPYPPLFEASGGRVTLREFIEHVVREEVSSFRTRQKQRRLFRVLTAGQIAEGVARGRVDPGGRDSVQEADEEAAVATALQAFEDGLYFIFIDGQQQTDLDATVHIAAQSEVTFLRLVALAGG